MVESIDEIWKRGFWYYIKYPIYIVTSIFGVMNSWDKYNMLEMVVMIFNRQNEFEKRIAALERRNKNG